MEHKLTPTTNGHAFVAENDSVLVDTYPGHVRLGVNTFGFHGAANSWNYSHLTAADARRVAAMLNAAADRAEGL